jgi:hypothetical protein
MSKEKIEVDGTGCLTISAVVIATIMALQFLGYDSFDELQIPEKDKDEETSTNLPLDEKTLKHCFFLYLDSMAMKVLNFEEGADSSACFSNIKWHPAMYYGSVYYSAAWQYINAFHLEINDGEIIYLSLKEDDYSFEEIDLTDAEIANGLQRKFETTIDIDKYQKVDLLEDQHRAVYSKWYEENAKLKFLTEVIDKGENKRTDCISVDFLPGSYIQKIINSDRVLFKDIREEESDILPLLF